jgi:hypothetical protein
MTVEVKPAPDPTILTLAVLLPILLFLWAWVPVDIKLVVFLTFVGWVAFEERKQVLYG